MDVHAVLVGGGGRRSRYREEKARAQALYERDLLLRRHAENAKHNARLKAQGIGGEFTCTPSCPTCHPARDAGNDPGLTTLDLRGKVATRKVLSGRRGKCKDCGARLANRRAWYCLDHLPDRRRHGRR